jgi:hypothetical protein
MTYLVTFEQPVTVEAAGGETRTIRGTAVPWNKVGTVSSGQRVKFLPGSLPLDARPVVTLGHDGPAFGRVSEVASSDAGMSAAVKVSDVQFGSDALTLAADGVLSMFSVGVDPTDYEYDEDGVLVVAAADWHHLALVPFGAFSDALVSDVAASQPNPKGPVMSEIVADPPTAELAAAPPDPPLPARIPLTVARAPGPELDLARYAQIVAASAQAGLSADGIRAQINAALTNITSTNVAGVVPPAYRAQIVELVNHGTPLMNVLASSPLPGTGMSLEYPQWTATPTTGVQATEKTAITSTAATVALKSAPVQTIAGGNDISLQAAERSSPSFLEAYFRAAAIDWSRKAEAQVIAALNTGAIVATPGASFLANVQALLAALDPAVTPAGPLFVAMSYDVALPLVSVTTANGPAFWEGRIDFGSSLPTVSGGGMSMFIDWNLPAKTMIGGSTQAATVHLSPGAPVDIRVVDVSLLGLDVGVYGFMAVTVEYPAAIAKMTLP